MENIRHQMSFVAGKRLWQRDFLAPHPEAVAMMEVLAPALRVAVQDFLIYVPRNPPPRSASDLVFTIRNALRQTEVLDHDFAEPRRAAANLDRQSAAGAPPTEYLLDFVWNNGVDDDNAFSDCFLGTSVHAYQNAFEECLARVLDGYAYGICFRRRDSLVADADLPDAHALLEAAARDLAETGVWQAPGIAAAFERAMEPYSHGAPGL